MMFYGAKLNHSAKTFQPHFYAYVYIFKQRLSIISQKKREKERQVIFSMVIFLPEGSTLMIKLSGRHVEKKKTGFNMPKKLNECDETS